MASKFFGFPNPVNEVSARLVAGFVVVMSLAVSVADQRWVLVPLAYGFVARVTTGPKLSPLGRLVTEVITPRLPFEPKLVAGPPKRFAQGIGAVLSTVALLSWGLGQPGLARVLAGAIAVAATLEAVFGFCLGCTIFGWLTRRGWVPESVCEACNDITRRPVAA